MFLSCSHTYFLKAESIGVGELWAEGKVLSKKQIIFELTNSNKRFVILISKQMRSFTEKSSLASKHRLAQSSLIDRFALQISVLETRNFSRYP